MLRSRLPRLQGSKWRGILRHQRQRGYQAMKIYKQRGRWIARYEGEVVIGPSFIDVFCRMLEVIHGSATQGE
jgi:hypothetical protein